MKKFAATILAVIYLSTSMGATLYLHYCMGKLFSWSLTDTDSKNCGRCGMPKSSANAHCLSFKDGCCKEKQAHVQLGKDQKTTENPYRSLDLSFTVLPGAITQLPGLFAVSDLIGHPSTHAPPKPDKVPLFIRNCHFRI